MSDPVKYRTKEEIEECKKRDSLSSRRSVPQAAGAPTTEEFEAIEESVKAEVDDAVKFADESPVLPASRLEAVQLRRT